MLVLILILSTYYDLVNGEFDVAHNFNETRISEQLRHSLMEVNSFLEDVQHKIQRESSVQKPSDYEEFLATKDHVFLDYSVTNIWWNETPYNGKMTPQSWTLSIAPDHQTPGTPHPEPEHTTVTQVPEHLDSPTQTHESTVTQTFHPRPPTEPDPPRPPPNPPDPPKRPPYPSRYPLPIPTLTLPPGTTATDTPLPVPHEYGPYGTPPYSPPPAYPEFEEKPTDPVHEDTTLYYVPTFPVEPSTESEHTTVIPEQATPQPESSPAFEDPGQPTIEQPSLSPTPPDSHTKEPHNIVPIPTKYFNISQEHVKELLQEDANFSVIEKYQWMFHKTRKTTGTGTYTFNHTEPSPHQDPAGNQPGARQGIDSMTFPSPPLGQGDPSLPGQVKIIKEDEQGFPVLVHETTMPVPPGAKITVLDDGRQAYVPESLYMPWTTTTIAGDVLAGRHTRTTVKDELQIYKDELYAVMNEGLVGYMSVFLLRLTYVIATKKEDQVMAVLRNMQPICNKLFSRGSLSYFGQPLLHVTMQISGAVSEAPADLIRNYALMVHYMLKDRKKTAAVDINSIIDYADSLYEDPEGDKLFGVLKELEDYPNITKSSYELCDTMVEYFMSPYRRLATSERRQRLLDSVNYALQARFPNLQGPDRRRFDVLPMTLRTGHKYTTLKTLYDVRTTRKRSPKMHRRQNRQKTNRSKYMPYIRSHRRTRVIRRRNHEHDDHRPDPDFNYEKFLRRSIYNPLLYQNKDELNVRNPYIQQPLFQKRFSIITSASQFPTPSRTERETARNPFVLYSRRTTDYKLGAVNRHDGNYGVPLYLNTNSPNFFLRKLTTASYPIDQRKFKRFKYPISKSDKKKNKRRTTRHTYLRGYRVRKRVKRPERRKMSEIVELKKDVLRRIVEGSSYSDEEEALKVNLIKAMVYGNRTYEYPAANSVDEAEGLIKRTTGHQTATIAINHDEWKDIDGAMQNRI